VTDVRDNPETRLMQVRDREAIERALEQLPLNFREVILLCDVEKMTPAAAHYIADRMAELGEDSNTMTLVLLSYNRGPGWVVDTLRQQREVGNYERNFWTLYAHRDQLDEQFRKENAAYVPAFFAAAIIGENPKNFGLPTPALSSLAKDPPK